MLSCMYSSQQTTVAELIGEDGVRVGRALRYIRESRPPPAREEVSANGSLGLLT